MKNFVTRVWKGICRLWKRFFGDPESGGHPRKSSKQVSVVCGRRGKFKGFSFNLKCVTEDKESAEPN